MNKQTEPEMPGVIYVHDHNGPKVLAKEICPESVSSIREYGYIRADIVEKMAEALRGSQAAFAIMLDSANYNTDLTDEGLANLFNATEKASAEALAAYEEIRK